MQSRCPYGYQGRQRSSPLLLPVALLALALLLLTHHPTLSDATMTDLIHVLKTQHAEEERRSNLLASAAGTPDPPNWVARHSPKFEACYRSLQLTRKRQDANPCPPHFSPHTKLHMCIAECPLEFPVKCGLECYQQGRTCKSELLQKAVQVGVTSVQLATLAHGIPGLPITSLTIQCGRAIYESLVNAVNVFMDRHVLLVRRKTDGSGGSPTKEKLIVSNDLFEALALNVPQAIVICSGVSSTVGALVPLAVTQLTTLVASDIIGIVYNETEGIDDDDAVTNMAVHSHAFRERESKLSLRHKLRRVIEYAKLLSNLDPTGIVDLAEKFVHPVCLPPAQLGRISDGDAKTALAMKIHRHVFRGSRGFWKQQGDGNVSITLTNYRCASAAVTIRSGGSIVFRVVLACGESYVWSETLAKLQGRTLYITKRRSALQRALPIHSSEQASIGLWVPQDQTDGQIFLHVVLHDQQTGRRLKGEVEQATAAGNGNGDGNGGVGGEDATASHPLDRLGDWNVLQPGDDGWDDDDYDSQAGGVDASCANRKKE